MDEADSARWIPHAEYAVVSVDDVIGLVAPKGVSSILVETAPFSIDRPRMGVALVPNIGLAVELELHVVFDVCRRVHPMVVRNRKS